MFINTYHNIITVLKQFFIKYLLVKWKLTFSYHSIHKYIYIFSIMFIDSYLYEKVEK